jgi:hypothetical protein
MKWPNFKQSSIFSKLFPTESYTAHNAGHDASALARIIANETIYESMRENAPWRQMTEIEYWKEGAPTPEQIEQMAKAHKYRGPASGPTMTAKNVNDLVELFLLFYRKEFLEQVVAWSSAAV